MADEKAFEPTQSRIDRAKREGDVARSQELCSVVAFACGLLAAAAVVPFIGGAARAALAVAASGVSYSAPLGSMLALMLVPALGAACGASACSVLQSGGIRFTAIAFKTERLSLPENLKRMFSREAAVTAARATIAFLCAAAALVPAFVAIASAALHAGSVPSVAQAAWNGALHAAAVACGVGALFACVDYGLQFTRWRKRLRMSFEELKRDSKENDGDPLARSRRRALHRSIARGSLQRVKDAAFVVTNPTHIAIALEYRPPEVPLPRVLVRTADDAAARVRELAGAHGVPLVENVPLARLLYARAEPGDFIPQETYVAVAEIVAALSKQGV